MTAKVFTVENRKGGCGKTTTAITIATAVAGRLPKDERVLIVDTDPQGDAAKALDVETNGHCLSDLLTGEASFSQVILPTDRSKDGGPRRPNLFIIPASDRLHDALATMLDDFGAMKELARKMSPRAREQMGLHTIPNLRETFLTTMAPLRDYFKYIIIDCPPSLGLLREAIHHYADYAIVPAKTDWHSVAQTSNHTQDILHDREGGAQIKILAVVPTFYQQRLLLTRDLMDQLEESYGDLLTQPVPLTTRVAQAPAMGGYTIFDIEPSSPAADAYQDVIDRVLNT